MEGYTLKEIVNKLDEKVTRLDDTIRDLERAVEALTDLTGRVGELEKEVKKQNNILYYALGAWAVIVFVGKYIIEQVMK